MDEAHPSQELAAEMSAILEDFIVSRDARRMPDLRQRLENIREEREEDVDPEDRDRDGSVDGEEGHQEDGEAEMEGDVMLQIEISSDEQELLGDRQEDYKEARERIARENERARQNARQSRNDREDSIGARYEQELRENPLWSMRTLRK